MSLVFGCFYFLFPELKNGAFREEFLFLLIDFVQCKDLVRINQILLELDVEYFELEILLRFFYFTVNFHHFFVLVVLFLVFSHVNFRIHRSDTLNKTKVFLLNAKVFHDLLRAFISGGEGLIGSFGNDELGGRSGYF